MFCSACRGSSRGNRSIRARQHRENDTFYRDSRDAGRWPLSTLHDRCRAKAEAEIAAHPEAQQRAVEEAKREAERAEEKRRDQYDTAANLFADVHPAANRLVNSVQENAFTTVWEGGPEFTRADLRRQIGAVPGREYGQDDDETNDEMPNALPKAWEHLDCLAAAGERDSDRWVELVDGARDVMAYAYGQPGPVVLEKTPESWQVLVHTDSPLPGRLGRTCPCTPSSAPRRARPHPCPRWQEEGPHAAWFAFLADEVPAIDALRET